MHSTTTGNFNGGKWGDSDYLVVSATQTTSTRAQHLSNNQSIASTTAMLLLYCPNPAACERESDADITTLLSAYPGKCIQVYTNPMRA